MGVIRWGRRIALVSLLIFALTALGVLLADYSLRRSRPSPDVLGSVRVVIVLGSGIRRDGSLTVASRNRIAQALSLVGDKADVWLICSGGLMYTAKRLTAAGAMRNWAIEQGFPADRIIAERRSRSTLENLVFSLPVARRMGARPDDASLMIVTDTTHAPRARALAWVLGWRSVAISASDTFSGLGNRAKAQWIVREALAIWWNVGKVAAWKALGLAGYSPNQRLEYVY